MRGKTKAISFAAILSVIIVISMVFASGAVNVSKMSLFSSSPVNPDSPGTTVFVDPDAIIGDYYAGGFEVGDTFSVSVNVTTDVVPGIYSYQVNMTWNSAVLNYTGISSYGDFLAKTGSIYGTSRVEKIDSASNETGYAVIAETILGDYAGITSSGRLFTIGFEIVGYGASNLTIGTGGDLPTMLLDSTGAQMPFTAVSGYFRNALLGDANLDKIIDVFDILKVKNHRSGPPPGPGGYFREADINDDGSIDVFDILIVKANLGRSVP